MALAEEHLNRALRHVRKLNHNAVAILVLTQNDETLDVSIAAEDIPAQDAATIMFRILYQMSTPVLVEGGNNES